MPEWLNMMFVFVGLTAGYFAGYLSGTWRSDRAPSAAAWQNVRVHASDCNKEVSIHEMDLAHEEQMRMIDRGLYDSMYVEGMDED